MIYTIYIFQKDIANIKMFSTEQYKLVFDLNCVEKNLKTSMNRWNLKAFPINSAAAAQRFLHPIV